MQLIVRAGLVLSILLGTLAQANAGTLYYYHQKPPYVVSAEDALGDYFDLMRSLNQVAGSEKYQLRFQPRARLERDLNSGQLQGAVLGVNPVWFNDVARRRFFWTDPIGHDRDLVISHRDQPFHFGQAPLIGNTVCYVRGYFYEGITQLVRNGEMRLFPVAQEVAIFDALDQSRCDFGIISESMYHFLRSSGEINSDYFIAEQPQAEYDRLILVPLDQPQLFNELQQHLRLLKAPSDTENETGRTN